MHTQKNAPFKARCLLGRRRLEGLAVAAEPGGGDAVAAHPLVDAAGNGFHLRQFGHLSIVEAGWSGDVVRSAWEGQATCNQTRS